MQSSRKREPRAFERSHKARGTRSPTEPGLARSLAQRRCSHAQSPGSVKSQISCPTRPIYQKIKRHKRNRTCAVRAMMRSTRFVWRGERGEFDQSRGSQHRLRQDSLRNLRQQRRLCRFELRRSLGMSSQARIRCMHTGEAGGICTLVRSHTAKLY